MTEHLPTSDFELALERLVLADQLCPSDTTAKKMMAACYRKLDRPDDERAVLEQIASLDSDDVALYERLLELTSAGKDWLATSRFNYWRCGCWAVAGAWWPGRSM